MKIGLILFGHLRSYRQTHATFLQLKNELQQQAEILDVFCHTWDIEESVTPSWWKEHKNDQPPPASVSENEIISKYRAKAYCIEPSKHFDEPDFGIETFTPLAGMMSMLYSQLKAFELLKEYERQNNIRYDIVIKTRYDLLYEITPEFTSLVQKCIKENCLYLPSSNPYELTGAYSDIFALGPRPLIEEYFEFNKDINGAVNIYTSAGYKELVPELLMTVFLKKNNVIINEITGLRIHVLRMSGEKFQINTCKDFFDNWPMCFYSVVVDKCRGLLQNNKWIFEKNDLQVTEKYLSWLDRGLNEDQLKIYAAFKNGEWLSLRETAQLAKLAKRTKRFLPNVMQNFFETAIMNAKYGVAKTMIQASVLAINGYGLFYFKVLRKKMVG